MVMVVMTKMTMKTTRKRMIMMMRKMRKRILMRRRRRMVMKTIAVCEHVNDCQLMID